MVTGGYGAKPLTATAFSAAASTTSGDQVVAATVTTSTGTGGTGADTGSVHRNPPLAIGAFDGADEPSAAGTLPIPSALPDPDDVQRPEDGPIEDAVGTLAPVPSAAAAAIEQLVASADQAVSPMSSFPGQIIYPGSDVVAPREEVAVVDRLVSLVREEGTQPAMTMLPPQSHS
ncbi:MAG: hypothetical protein ACRDTC_10825 [Pseudonocardiaceae bacterium]